MIKIDIDGGELDYLKKIDLARNRALIVEMNEEQELKSFLTVQGYTSKRKLGHNWLWVK